MEVASVPKPEDQPELGEPENHEDNPTRESRYGIPPGFSGSPDVSYDLQPEAAPEAENQILL